MTVNDDDAVAMSNFIIRKIKLLHCQIEKAQKFEPKVKFDA